MARAKRQELLRDGDHLVFVLRQSFRGAKERVAFWRRSPLLWISTIVPRIPFIPNGEDGRRLRRGDHLLTPTGRRYEVVVRRVQWRGAHIGRQHLLCRVTERRPGRGHRTLPIQWYPRGRGRRPT